MEAEGSEVQSHPQLESKFKTTLVYMRANLKKVCMYVCMYVYTHTFACVIVYIHTDRQVLNIIYYLFSAVAFVGSKV